MCTIRPDRRIPPKHRTERPLTFVDGKDRPLTPDGAQSLPRCDKESQRSAPRRNTAPVCEGEGRPALLGAAA